MKMTVYFDGAFWSALIEFKDSKGRYKAFPYIFGKEPRDEDIWSFLHGDFGKWLSKYDGIDVASNIEAPAISPRKINPKRMQREINRAKRKPAVSTKAQQAMQDLQEEVKREKKSQRKAKREAYKALTYQLKQEKRRQKKRGH